MIKANALELNFPAAKAQAFKNAAQSIGKAFGRDIIRKDEAVDDYNPIIDKDDNIQLLDELKALWTESVHTQTTIDKINSDAKKGLSNKQVNEIRKYMENNYKEPIQ